MSQSNVHPLPPSKDQVLATLRAAWDANPHERLCQLIVNAAGRDDLFYVEDHDLRIQLAGLRHER